jgi:TIR domain
MSEPNTRYQLEYDFYISANRESAAAQEVARVLQEAGYFIYLPKRKSDVVADRLAANGSKAFVLLLVNEREQTRFLADILNFLPGAEQRRVIIIQFEECELASLIDPNLITNLTGLIDSQARKIRILESMEVPLQSNLMAQADEGWWPVAHTLEEDATGHQLEAFRPGETTALDPAQQPITFQEGDGPRGAMASKELSASPALDTDIDQRWPETPKEISEARRSSPKLEAAAHDDGEKRKPPTKNLVEFAVSHPTQFSMGVPFIIDVLIYRQEDRRAALLRAGELSSDNGRVRSAGATEVAQTSKLRIAIKLPWSDDPEIQTVCWNGVITKVSLQIIPPKYATSKTVYGNCKVSVDGLTIGRVAFQLHLGRGDDSDDRQISRARAFKSAFASYAPQDRRHVLARVQGVERLGVKVFMDVHGRGGNEQCKEENYQVIDSSDILYLFWSRHARRSKCVEQEWRHAMKKRGAGFINPVPLVDLSKVPPPIELADQKHFGDWTKLYSEYKRSLSTLDRIRSWLPAL